ncbi:BirA family biotin operon repressor/biotin-[acetyl-CoA-carboxylase] ligase [Elusimicrobium simillimum]|uniref:biotin--[acetyl-CoA-carboxylase] ligase n=1 Tax=Elusimicrobium simillimum TaxID=3143438 RepID=UPI003C6EFBAC
MHNILEFDELNSTNTYVKENAAALSDKTAVVALRQYSGRGRFDRTWVSDEGGLYFTLVLKPAKTDFLHNLTQLMCVSVCTAVNAYGLKSYIKWPNDVHINKQKICGILSEAVIKDGKFYALALGTGINVGQAAVNGVNQSATSLKEQGVEVGRQDILNAVLNNFFSLYEDVINNGFAAISEQYRQLFPFLGTQVTLSAQGNITGLAAGISDLGELILLTPEGKEIKVLTGEII